MSLVDKIKHLPKIELHHHLDGSLRSSTLWDLYQNLEKLGWKDLYFADENSLKISVQCNENTQTLEDFLSKFNVINSILRAAHKFLSRDTYFGFLRRIGQEVVEDQFDVGCVYFETRFYPISWINDMTDLKLIVETIMLGMQENIEKFDHIAAKIIISALWDHPEYTMTLVDLAKSLQTSKNLKSVCVVGVDLAGNESGLTISDTHKNAFRYAKSIGLGITVHVGLPHRSIQEAVEDLCATRIGHGYHISESNELIAYVLKNDVHIETSITPACRGMNNYHIKKQEAIQVFFDQKISFSLNTDDNTIKNISLTDECLLAATVLKQSDEKIIKFFTEMQRTTLNSTFLSEDEKIELSTWLA